MIGIYQDNFLDFLREHLGNHIKITSKNIVVPCPFCEFNQQKNHYHMYISLEAPIFHCFHASCERGGTLRKLIKKIKGVDVSDTFVDKEKIKEYKKTQNILKEKEDKHKVKTPELKPHQFRYKDFYLKKRLKFFNIESTSIKGLVYDINQFIDINNVPVNENLFRIRDYLHSNFIGFVSEHNTTLICRNVDPTQSMRYYKLKLHDSYFSDYYRLWGRNPHSNTVVLSEGIFDIFAEQIYDSLNIQKDVRLYASAFSANYTALIRSIVFHEQLFRPDVVILSDRGIDLEPYRKTCFFNKHIINSMVLYYNLTGKDFNEVPICPRRINIDNKGAKKRWQMKKQSKN